MIQQSELKELDCDFDFSNQGAELTGSRLLQWKLLVKETISLFRKRLKIFQKLENGDISLCLQ
jgi:hypothetical protein